MLETYADRVTMIIARKIKQLVVIAPNEVGTLAEICRTIREAGGSITHVCASALGEDARFMLNVPNLKEFQEVQVALKKLAFEIRTVEVVEAMLENSPGTLEPVAEALRRAEVDIEFLYATTGDGKRVAAILSTNDNDLAVSLINKA